ncbi:centrosomal protein of 85 kDa isoform X2 [Hyperolius riggenbachi]|uniref:centrosomal protein of 85 kDa isoform X2 n=1 Tax=Hyperolius riggenbachi TaxID=752182 RepID=UPI0035A37FA5
MEGLDKFMEVRSQQPSMRDFCNASGSTPFQPIRNQVAIPTAHVVPSTLASCTSNVCTLDKNSLPADAALSAYPYLSTLEPSTADDTKRFEMPNIEPTLNQSALLNTFCNDPRQDMANTIANHYKALPESKEIGGIKSNSRGGHLEATHQAWGLDPYKKPPGAEYNTWSQLQNQYTENLRLKMEKLQFARDYSTMPTYPVALHQNPNDWERAVKANDHLLEKEMLEWQRQHIFQLEQRMREMQTHSTMLSQRNPYNDMSVIRLQDLQREVTFLRAQFAEKTESSAREKVELEKKLCAVEAENKELKEAMKTAAQKHSDELKKQDERVKGRERHINSLKKKCQKEVEQNKERQQKIETLERYLADLPTVQDHQKQLQKAKDLHEKNCLLTEQVSHLEIKLGELRAAFRENEAKLEAKELKEQEHLNTIESLQKDLKKLETTDWKMEEKRLLKEAENLQREIETQKKDQEYLRKMVESQKKKLEQTGKRVKELEEQLCHEESTGQVLKEESHQKEAALQQLKAAVKELAAQNQDLMERNVTLQEQLRLSCVKEQPTQNEATQLFKLYKEMNRCQKDLRTICSLLRQRTQGSDPNLSMLLGVHSTPISEDQEEPMDLLSLERYVKGVEQLKNDIEDLRTTISDHYAQDMGEHCITQ